MLNTVKLNHTVWYDGREKILRLFMSDYIKASPLNLDYADSGQDDSDIIKIHSITKNIMTFGDLPMDMLYFSDTPSGPRLEDFINIVYNETEQTLDFHLLPTEKFNNDGELVINLNFKIYSGKKSNYNESDNMRNIDHNFQVVIPIQTAVKPIQNQMRFTPQEVKKLTLRNGTTMTPSGDNKVVYTFELIRRDITNEFATYGDVKEMIEGMSTSNQSTSNQSATVDANSVREITDNLYYSKSDVDRMIQKLRAELIPPITSFPRAEFPTTTTTEQPQQ